MKLIFGDEFIFNTSSMYEIYLHCHWPGFSSFILNFRQCAFKKIISLPMDSTSSSSCWTGISATWAGAQGAVQSTADRPAMTVLPGCPRGDGGSAFFSSVLSALLLEVVAAGGVLEVLALLTPLVLLWVVWFLKIRLSHERFFHLHTLISLAL